MGQDPHLVTSCSCIGATKCAACEQSGHTAGCKNCGGALNGRPMFCSKRCGLDYHHREQNKRRELEKLEAASIAARPKQPTILTCPICLAQFEKRSSRSRFCGKNCSQLASYRRQHHGAIDAPKDRVVECAHCSVEFIDKTNSKTGRFCSRRCKRASHAGKSKPPVAEVAEPFNDEIPRDWTGFLDRAVRKEHALPWEKHPVPYDPRDCVVRGAGLRVGSSQSESACDTSARSGQGTAASPVADQTRTDQSTKLLQPKSPGPTGGSASRRLAASSSSVAS